MPPELNVSQYFKAVLPDGQLIWYLCEGVNININDNYELIIINILKFLYYINTYVHTLT